MYDARFARRSRSRTGLLGRRGGARRRPAAAASCWTLRPSRNSIAGRPPCARTPAPPWPRSCSSTPRRCSSRASPRPRARADETAEVALSEPLAEYLIGRAHPLAADRSRLRLRPGAGLGRWPASWAGWPSLRTPSATGAQGHLRALEDAAVAVSTEVTLRRRQPRGCAHSTISSASHNRVHELISQAAPLERGAGRARRRASRRYEPSVIPCVVLLDRETSTLHPGRRPVAPRHWLAAIDGVVIGPNVGTCGSARGPASSTITEDMTVGPEMGAGP